jgi:hypothetical protein
VTLDGLFARISGEQLDGVPLERHFTRLRASATTPLTVDEYDSAAGELAAFRAVVGPTDPTVVSGEHSLLTALSTSMSSERAHQQLARIDAAIHAFTGAITVDAKRVTLTSKRAEVPISFENRLTPPRTVMVRVHLESEKLVFPRGADQVVPLRPGNTTLRAPFVVEVRASGTFPMTITLSSRDGRLAFGKQVRVTVRSAVFGGFAVVLTVGALVFLAAWWVNHMRRTRRDRRAAQQAAT